jgi:gamma-glutamylputrescine oxidase
MARIGNNTYFAHGYSGHGVTGSHVFGRIFSEAISGDFSHFDVFAGLPWIPFPGGRVFSVPYSVIGSWWYSEGLALL